MSPSEQDASETTTPVSKVARSVARLNAVQALYQLAMSGGTVDAIVGQFATTTSGAQTEEGDEPMADGDAALFAELVRGTNGKLDDVDRMVSSCLDEAWPVERMEVLLRAILRCGAFEMFSRSSVPARVVISEYVRVTDAFFEGKEPALVNAVLDKLARVLRPEELATDNSRQ